MKKISLILGMFLLVFIMSACGRKADTNVEPNSVINDEQAQKVLTETMNISREYLNLRLRTDDVLITASSYPNYEQWNTDMTAIISDWGALEAEAKKLEESAGDYADGNFAFKIINTAQAYSNQEISDVFDKAPAGKKIKTLAQFLGVDAKRAFEILKQDQAQVEANAWNEAGDTFQALESTASVIKDGCKVAGFVGTIAMTGGTAAIAAGSTLSQAAVVVSGADLVLEVTDDAAKIALGNNNKVSSIVGDVRVVTEPLSAILMVSTLPNSLELGIDKLNAVSFGLDQLNSSVQDGKAIGIALPAYTKGSKQNAKVSILDKTEIDKWLSDQGKKTSPETIQEIQKILSEGNLNMQEADAENGGQADDAKTQSEDRQENADSGNGTEATGIWEGILTYTPSQTEGEQQTAYILNLKNDGTVDPSENGEDFSTWEKTGNGVKLFFKDSAEGAYFEFSLSGDTMTFVKLAGPNSEGKWQEDYAGEDFFGGKFYEIVLKKQ